MARRRVRNRIEGARPASPVCCLREQVQPQRGEAAKGEKHHRAWNEAGLGESVRQAKHAGAKDGVC